MSHLLLLIMALFQTTVYSKLPLNSMQSNGLLSMQSKSATKTMNYATQTLTDAIQTVNHATKTLPSATHLYTMQLKL